PHLRGVADVIESPLARDGELAAELVFGDGPLVVEALALGGLVAGVGAAVTGIARRPLPRRTGRRRRRPYTVQPLVVPVQPEPEALHFHAPDPLLERLLERPPDGHRLADAFHLRGQRLVGVGEFFERPAGGLDDAVVDRGLEA